MNYLLCDLKNLCCIVALPFVVILYPFVRAK